MPSPVSPERVSLPERYRVVRHLRAGGMASLWQAHDDLLDRDVAVKVLAEHLSADSASRERFEREARAAARLSSHPHVVTIYDVGECGGSVYIVMELMPQGSLADRLASGGPVSRATAVGWLTDAASALDDAHAAGIVHRDVKPGNMLLDDRGRLALADFGIARVAREEQLTRTGEILGTMAYIAPEQALGRPATPASDRYALAVVAYELLAGRRPFEADHPAAQARAHVEDAPPPVGPVALDAVLRRGLAKDPAERWGSAAVLVAALERATAAQPAQATARTRPARAPGPPRGAPTPPVTTRARPRRSGTPWLVAAALAVVVGLGLAAALGGSGGEGGKPASTSNPASASGTRSTPAQSRTTTTSAPSTATTTTRAAPPAAAAAGDLSAARGLQVAGYRARLSGSFAEALALDRRVLAACGDRRALDPCGYALFEAGAVLRRLGRGDEASGFLRQRLSTYGDNPAGEVGRELALVSGPGQDRGHAKKPKKPKKHP